MSCVWNANGSITCDRACDKTNLICHDVNEYFANNMNKPNPNTTLLKYSINIIVTNADKSAIFYSKALPSISSDAYIIDTISLSSLQNRTSHALLTIQDLTNYQGPVRPPPHLQLIIQNHLGTQNLIQFSSQVGMNVLLRTATIALPATSPTLVIMDRLQMGLL
jgi:hypothetical protein